MRFYYFRSASIIIVARLVFLFIIIFFISCGEHDKEAVIEKEVLEQPSKDSLNLNNPLANGVYKLILFSNKQAVGAGSCFFITVSAKNYLVTARHMLYGDDPITKERLQIWRGCDQMAFLVVDKQTHSITPGHVKVSSDDLKISSILINGNIVDILIIELNSASLPQVQFTDFINQPDAEILKEGMQSYIIGYPANSDEVKIVTTKLLAEGLRKDGKRPSIFLTEHDSEKGVSGGPVFITTNNNEKPFFLGIYTGYSKIGNSGIEHGIVVNGNNILDFFNETVKP